MPTEKALALVIRGTDWSETSRITTLFTREFGKVRALAKGGRRVHSNFEIAFDLLSVCHVVFIRKDHGGLDLLTEARLEERFPILRNDLNALYAGYYIAELLADGTQDYDPHPPLFDAAVSTLRGLQTNHPSPNHRPDTERGHPPPSLAGKGAGGLGSIADSVMSFELVWLKELGYSPRLDVCAGCGSEQTDRLAFSPQAGGMLCSSCGSAAADRRPLSLAGLEALREMTESAESDSPLSPRLTPSVRGELRGLLGQVVSFVLGRRPRLLGYVEGGAKSGD